MAQRFSAGELSTEDTRGINQAFQNVRNFFDLSGISAISLNFCLRYKKNGNFICLTSLTRAKCGIPSTLCWKIPNISGSIELFAL